MTTFRNLAAALLASLVAIGTVGYAEPAPTDTIIVTATRTEIPLQDATVPVTVISREDIELSMATDLAELLRFEAGIDLGRNGGAGQSTSVFLRGTESNHTLVLIDGVRINPGTIGGAAIQHVAPELIERVEIVKGARSALFGTDAIGGVVNIITRRAEDAYFESSAGAGSFGTRTITASGGNRGEKGEFGVTFNGQRSDGYAPRTDSPVQRGYENRSASLYATRRIGTSELSFRHWQTGGTVEYLDFFLIPVDQDFENATSAVELVSRPTDRGTSKLLVSYLRDDISQNQTEDFVESDRVSVDWQYSQAYDEHTFTGGLYGIDEKASTLSFGAGFEETTRVRAAFLQDQWSHGRHRSFLAMRLTDHEASGRQVTWNAEYAFDVGRDWTLNAGLGHAFRAPDATDRYGFGGSPDLEPEVADEAQLGLRYTGDTGHGLEFELYANDIEDLIEFDLQAFALRNVAAAEIRGAQVAWEYRGEHFSVRAELLKQRADDARTGERLIRRAEESATLSFVRNVGKHRLGLALLASGDREDLGGAKLPGYVLADLTAQFALGGAWELHARIENLLDSEYQTAEFYRMPERSAFVELQYRWD